MSNEAIRLTMPTKAELLAKAIFYMTLEIERNSAPWAVGKMTENREWLEGVAELCKGHMGGADRMIEHLQSLMTDWVNCHPSPTIIVTDKKGYER